MKIAAKTLKLLTDIVTLMTDDVDIYPDEGGWDIRVIDSAHVSMAHIRISKDLFTDFAVWDRFTMDAAKVKEMLKHTGEEIELEMGSGRMDIISDRLTQHMAIPVSTFPNVKVPDIQTTSASIMVDAEPLKRLLKAAGDRMEYCRLIVGANGVKIIARRNDDDVDIMIPADECISIAGEAKSSYPLSYMQKFAAVMPKGTIPEFRFSDDFPLVIDFGDQTFSVTWIVAPRIGEDDL